MLLALWCSLVLCQCTAFGELSFHNVKTSAICGASSQRYTGGEGTTFGSFPMLRRTAPSSPVGVRVNFQAPARGYNRMATPLALRAAPSPATEKEQLPVIKGLADDFEYYAKVDATIRELQAQLPSLLTKPLTALTASRVYTKECPLVVVVESSSVASAAAAPDDDKASLQDIENPENDKYEEDNKPKPSRQTREITLTSSTEELTSLSDVIVLGTTAAQQANNVWSSTTNTPSTYVKCQLWLDPSLETIRIPWKTAIPVLGSPSSTNRFDGFSEVLLDSETGKIRKHRILNVTYNDTPMNGPAIGLALTTWQTAVNNVQQFPFIKSFLSPSTTSLLAELRDGLLDQAASAASQRQSKNLEDPSSVETPLVFVVPEKYSISSSLSWVNSSTTDILQLDKNGIPFPGSSEWTQYARAHQSLATFCDSVIPILSGSSFSKNAGEEVTRLFSNNVTLTSSILDDSVLLRGRENIASYYTSLALARRGAGGSWTLTKAEVDWKNYSVTIDYKAALNSVPTMSPWAIQGRDVYYLECSDATQGKDPVIQRIQQVKFAVSTQDGSMKLDNKFVMENLVRTVEQGGLFGSGRDILSDLLLRQVAGAGERTAIAGRTSGPNAAASSKSNVESARTSTTGIQPRRLPLAAAANIFHLMSDLHDQLDVLLDVTADSDSNRVALPAVEYIADSVELRGYLGETLVRGSTLYQSVLGAILTALRRSVAQKSLIVVKTPPKRVIELTPTGVIRLSLTLQLRLGSPIGSNRLFPEAVAEVASAVSVPLTLELVSDYVLDPRTGQIEQHRLVESRVNGQLTPGDVLSRSVQRLLMRSSDDSNNQSDDDALLRPLSDALAWLRSISGGPGLNGG
jgi:hypothetical protein